MVNSNFSFPYVLRCANHVVVWCVCRITVLIIVAISFAGLAVCLTIICCGLVCLKR